MVTPRRLRLAALTVVLAAASSGGQAHAEQVVVVDHDGAQRVEDPFVPPRAETDLGPAETDLGPAPGGPGIRAYPSANGPGAVDRGLRRAGRERTVTPSKLSAYRRTYRRARSTWGRLRGARRGELGYVIQSLERLALAGRLTPSRMPAVFLQLGRNSAYWASQPFPGARDPVTFRGSEILYLYFPGRGLQIHPLANFKKANLLHGACGKSGSAKPVCGAKPPGPSQGAPCRPARLRRLLDELSSLAVQRGRGFIAWEYMFEFGGGSPPWISGMAQATAISALGRGSKLLGRPDYDVTAKAALGAFEARPPSGVRATGPLGGAHYLQYSFAPRLFIFNAFLQSLIGLHDYGKLVNDSRATRLFTEAEPEARREVPHSDVGDWSRYSFRGPQSSQLYHELLRELLLGMGRRLGLESIYCTSAIRYRGYQTQPPTLSFNGPQETAAKRPARVRFTLSKLSVVELKIYEGDRLARRSIATFRRGSHSFPWRPGSGGRYAIRLGAKELRTGRSLRGRTAGTVLAK